MANPAKRLLMEPYPEDEFIKAVKEVVLANQDFVSPYGSSGTLYLDPKKHKYIDEFGGANFYGITKDGQFQTPKSDSILPSITKRSILKIAKDLDPIETKIPIDDVNRFAEAGAMGTAAVISPVGSLTYKGKKHVFGNGKDAGPITQKLYDTLTGIQFSDLEDKYGWIVKLS